MEAEPGGEGGSVGSVEAYVELLEQMRHLEEDAGPAQQLGEDLGAGGFGVGAQGAGGGEVGRWAVAMDKRMEEVEGVVRDGLAGLQAEQRAQRELLELIRAALVVPRGQRKRSQQRN
jgi:hypothetical protein